MVDDNKKKFTDEMINNILYKLTIISYIKQGEKLCCYDNNIIIDESYIQSISRFFSNQNRTDAIDHISNLINDSIEITDFIYRCELSVRKNLKEKENRQSKTFFKNSNEKILKQFFIKMTNAIDGLNNLKLTYNSDITIKTNIELLITRIQQRISKIEDILIISV